MYSTIIWRKRKNTVCLFNHMIRSKMFMNNKYTCKNWSISSDMIVKKSFDQKNPFDPIIFLRTNNKWFLNKNSLINNFGSYSQKYSTSDIKVNLLVVARSGNDCQNYHLCWVHSILHKISRTCVSRTCYKVLAL